jgi:transcriptional regulator with XRE-family HTH domain
MTDKHIPKSEIQQKPPEIDGDAGDLEIPDDELLAQIFGRIQAIWKTKDLPQEAGAKALGLSNSAFNHIMTGNAKLIGLIHVLKLAKFMGVTISEITAEITRSKTMDSSPVEATKNLSHRELGELMTRMYEAVGEEFPGTNPETRMSWALEGIKQLTVNSPTREEIVVAIKQGLVERAQRSSGS